MTEVASFRIEEDEARKYLAGDEGVYLGGGTRELRVRTADPLFARIGEIAQELWTKRRVFFTSWQIRREYSAQECERAELFQLKIDAVFEPCGEECGTQYDESSACPVCGTGSRQASELVLNTRKIPKKKDFARSIGNEVVVTQLVADLISREGLTGVRLQPVRHTGRRKGDDHKWWQMLLTSDAVSLSAQTRAGVDPFDEDSENRYRCPFGHVAGLNLLSELWLERAEYSGSDVGRTKESFGLRKGLLRPAPALLISPRTWKLFTRAGFVGWKYEVAYLNPPR